MKMYDPCSSSEGNHGGSGLHNLAEEDNLIADIGSKHEKGDDHVDILVGNEVDMRADVERIDVVETHASSNDMAEDDMLKDTSVVAESDMQNGKSEGDGDACKESSARLLVSSKMRDVDGSGRVDGVIQTSGSIKSISGPETTPLGWSLWNYVTQSLIMPQLLKA